LAAGNSQQLSGEPGQFHTGVSPQVSGCISRRASARHCIMRGVPGAASRIVSWPQPGRGPGISSVFDCGSCPGIGTRKKQSQDIGKGTIGIEPFRRLLNDPRTEHAAFIAETPIDEPQDDLRNVATLKSLVETKPNKKRA